MKKNIVGMGSIPSQCGGNVAKSDKGGRLRGRAPSVKKVLSLFLSLVMVFIITAGIDFSSYAAENAKAKSTVDNICSTSGFRPNVDNYNDCYAYASAFCNKMYGCAPGGTSGYTLTRPGNFYLVGQTTGTGVSAASLSSLLSQAMPGDVVQMKWYTNAALSSSSQHTAIVYSADSTSFTILQDGASWSTIQKSTYNYSSYYTRWRGSGFGISLYRYNNYNSKFPSNQPSSNPNLPAKPSISKIDILSNSEGKIRFEWASTTNTTCYNLFIYSVNNTKNPVQSHWAIRKNELTTTLPNGKYVARLCSENETTTQNYYTDGDFSATFEINHLYPDKPYISNINITNSSGKVDFKWNNISNATCYNLFIYSVNDTKNPVQSHWAIRKNELITTLPNGKYVARLCSENETASQNYYTDGDLSSTFEINSLVPDKPTEPNIIVENSTGKVTFKWDGISNATCYNLFIYSANDTNNPVQSHWAIRKNELITTLPNGKYVARLCSENETSKENYYTNGNLSRIFTVNKITHTHTYVAKISKPSTCTSTGTRTYTCSICGATKTETIPKTAHTYDNGKVTKEETCVLTGVKTYTCTKCSAVKTEIIPVSEYHGCTTKVVKPTCTKQGYTIYECVDCGVVFNDDYTKALGHKYTTKVVKPTYISEGYTLHTCTRCKKSYKDKKTKKLVLKNTSISKITAGKKAFTVKWKKQTSQTTGYQIQYSTSSKFKGGKTVTISKNKTTFKKVTKLKAKKKYYVRIRTYKTVKVNGKNTKVYSVWSKAKTVKTK